MKNNTSRLDFGAEFTAGRRQHRLVQIGRRVVPGDGRVGDLWVRREDAVDDRAHLVRRAAGGSGGGGTSLTQLGKDLLRGFAELQEEHRAFINRLGTNLHSIDELSKLTVVEAAELSKLLEEKWGVSAAAPVAVALVVTVVVTATAAAATFLIPELL